MPEDIQILIVGSGKFVRFSHIPNIFKTPGARIVGAVEPGEPSREALRELCAEHGQTAPPLYHTIEEFVKRGGARILP